jgi:hypothetical protein
MLILVEKILNLHSGRVEYLQAIITGPIGIGKSSYCLQVAHDFFIERYKISDEEAWTRALDCMVFSKKEIIAKFKKHDYENRADIIILDDATVHLGHGQWFLDHATSMELESLLTTARTTTHCLLVNCPNQEDLMRYLRNMSGLRINIAAEGNDRLAYIRSPWHKIKRDGVGTTNYRKVGRDRFSPMLPDNVFKKYIIKRNKYKDEALSILEGKKNGR